MRIQMSFNGDENLPLDLTTSGDRMTMNFGAVQSGGSGVGLPPGGTTGQALRKNSDTDYDASWQDAAGLPPGGVQGDIIVKRSATAGDAEWVAPANAVEQDNTLPITSAAVYTAVGNINALLATI